MWPQWALSTASRRAVAGRMVRAEEAYGRSGQGSRPSASVYKEMAGSALQPCSTGSDAPSRASSSESSAIISRCGLAEGSHASQTRHERSAIRVSHTFHLCGRRRRCVVPPPWAREGRRSIPCPDEDAQQDDTERLSPVRGRLYGDCTGGIACGGRSTFSAVRCDAWRWSAHRRLPRRASVLLACTTGPPRSPRACASDRPKRRGRPPAARAAAVGG